MQFVHALERLAADPCALLLVVNRRLERSGQQAYAQLQLARGACVWPRPAIATFDDWLHAHTERVIQSGRWPAGELPDAVLDDDDELALWEAVVRADAGDIGLLSPRDLAQEAQRAHALLCEYGDAVTGDDLAEEVRRFLIWQGEFRRRCAARGWLAGADWRAQQIARLELAPLPRLLLLQGHDDIRPWLQRLIDAVRAGGGDVQRVDDARIASDQQRLAPADAEAETLLVARWCRAHLDARPQARIAIVVPTLEARAASLQRALMAELEPARSLGFDRAPSAEINVSLGSALADAAPVACALRLLQLLTRSDRWPLASLSPLLLSPYLVPAEEAGALALLDAWLRRNGHATLSAKQLAFWLHEQPPAGSHNSVFAAHWRSGMQAAEALRKRRRLREWSALLPDVLAAFGWPGATTLDSHDYQAREAFFKELAALGRARLPEQAIGFAEAVQALQQRCRARLFQPEQPGTARVLVVGLLEAAGMPADVIWVLDARDEVLPAPIRPNALLPLRWQRERGLPRASHSRELQLAQIFVERLAGAAPQVFWSCPQHEGDRELRVSPFLRALPLATFTLADFSAATAFARQAGVALETLADEPVTPVGEGEYFRRDSRLLAVQAINPQAAFVEYRLHADVVDPLPLPGLPRERGTLVHEALALLWRRLEHSEQLFAQDDDARQQLCSDAASHALKTFETQTRESFPPRWRALEQQVLATLLDEWLQFEKQRAPGFAPIGIEQACALRIGDLALDLRIDRVDVLADGRAVIIDYKTGSGWQAPDWFSERPRDVQLMLYALAVQQSLAAVVAGRVRAGDMNVKGLTDDDGVLPGLKADKRLSGIALDDLRERWQLQLSELASEFLLGDARNIAYDAAAEQLLAAPFLRLWHDTESETESGNESRFDNINNTDNTNNTNINTGNTPSSFRRSEA